MTAKRTTARDFGVKSIEVERFRNFTPMEIKLGRYVTVISGQNGTGKSTLLGMLGQPFGMAEMKDVFGRGMRAKFTDMFKLSPDHDIPGEHVYYVNLRDRDLYSSSSHVQVKSYKREGYKLPIRLVTGARRGKGDGNIDFPVIYLGLRRTYPVGEIPNATSAVLSLSDKEMRQFNTWYNSVFLTWRQDDLKPVELTASTAKRQRYSSMLPVTTSWRTRLDRTTSVRFSPLSSRSTGPRRSLPTPIAEVSS